MNMKYLLKILEQELPNVVATLIILLVSYLIIGIVGLILLLS